MGFYAHATDGGDQTPTADFNTPPTDDTTDGTISGTVTDATIHRPIAGATVSIGGLDAGPDKLLATTDSSGRYTLVVPAYSYANVAISAPGYDRNLVPVNVPPNGAVALDPTLRRDWAARDGGASATSTAVDFPELGCGPNAVIDQRLTSTWSSSLSGKQPVTIELPVPVDISEIDLDPDAGCGDDSSASTRDYRVEVSATSASAGFSTYASGTFIAANAGLSPIIKASPAVRWVKVTPISSHGGSFIDFSEIGVYGRAHLDPPETTITAGPDGTDSDPTPTFTFESDQADATFQCRLDDGAYASCASPYTITPPLADGTSHSFDVRAINFNGDPDASPAHADFTIDTSLPDTSILSGPDPFTTSHTVTFTYSGGTSYECRVDAEAFATCPVAGVTRTLAEGRHTFAVRAIANGTDTSPATRTFTIDSTDPVVTVNTPVVDADAATFTFSAADATAVTFVCALDGGAPVACKTSKTYSALDNRTHVFTVTATDQAGNHGAGGASVLIDVTANETVLNVAPAGLVNDRDVHFEFSSPGTTSFECSLDGAAFTGCGSPQDYSLLADGAHTFDVRALGPGARVDLTPAHAAFTVDTTPPETLLTMTPLAVLTSRDFDLGFTANEPATFSCEVDGGVIVPCTSPLPLRGLADGQHSVVITATDLAGNTETTPAASIFTVAVPLPQPSPTPTPTPVRTPLPKASALRSVRVPKTASLKTLRKHRRLKLTVRAPKGAKLAVSSSLGKLTKRSRGKTLRLSLRLNRSRLRKAKPGSTLVVTVTAKGTGLQTVTRTFKVKLKV